MAVIGRLDGQVDEVLIAPLAKRRAPGQPEGSAADAPTGEPATPPPAPAERVHERESTEGRQELPVWLL